MIQKKKLFNIIPKTKLVNIIVYIVTNLLIALTLLFNELQLPKRIFDILRKPSNKFEGK